MTDQSGIEAEFRSLYEAWFAAIRDHDRGWFERTLADDFTYIHFEGGTFDKQGLIELDMAVEDADLGIREMSVELLAPDVALVVGHYYGRDVIADDAAITDAMRSALAAGVELRWSAVWLRREGTWRARLHHGTVIV
jgi:hypothetical protein